MKPKSADPVTVRKEEEVKKGVPKCILRYSEYSKVSFKNIILIKLANIWPLMLANLLRLWQWKAQDHSKTMKGLVFTLGVSPNLVSRWREVYSFWGISGP
jgi:hypothetical protein